MADNDVDMTLDTAGAADEPEDTKPVIRKREPWRIKYERQCTERELGLLNFLGKDQFMPLEFQPEPDNPTTLPVTIKITTSEGEEHVLHRNIYAMSKTLYNLVSTMPENDEAIPIDNITSERLKNIIAFIELAWPLPRGREYAHITNVEEEPEAPDADTPPVEQINKLGLTLDDTIYMAIDTNFLDMRSVYEKCAQHIGSIVQFMEPAEVCKKFNIKADDE